MPGRGPPHWANVECRDCGRSTTLELRPGEAAKLTCSRCHRRRPDVSWIAAPRRKRKATSASERAAAPAINAELVHVLLNDLLEDLFRDGGNAPRASEEPADINDGDGHRGANATPAPLDTVAAEGTLGPVPQAEIKDAAEGPGQPKQGTRNLYLFEECQQRGVRGKVSSLRWPSSGFPAVAAWPPGKLT
jgi:hypothetical protein